MRSRHWWPPVLAAGILILGLSGHFWAADGDGKSDDRKAQDAKIRALVKTVINRGADLHNIYRDSAGCYRYYQGSLTTLRGFLEHHPDLQKAIDAALTAAERAASMSERGLILNGALQKVWVKLNPNPKPRKDGDRPRAEDKPSDKPKDGLADKVVPKDLLKDVKPADKPASRPKTEKVPFDKAAKDK